MTLNQVINIVIRVVIVRVVNATINAGLRMVHRVRWRRARPEDQGVRRTGPDGVGLQEGSGERNRVGRDDR